MGSLYDNSGEDIYARRDIEKRRKHAMAMKKKRKRQILKRKIMLFTGAAAILVASLGLTAAVRKNNTASGSSLNPKETQQVAIDANADAANDDNIDKKDEKKFVYAQKSSDYKEITDAAVRTPYVALLDVNNNKIIAGREAESRIYPASMTKVMSLIVAVENVKDVTKMYQFTNKLLYPLYNAQASVAGFGTNEIVPVSDLFYGMILPSGADAAAALAEIVAGSEEQFAVLMNKKCEELGLKNTHFVNSTGLYDDEQYTTPSEMAMIMEYAMKDETRAKVLGTYQYKTKATAQHPEGIQLTSTMYSRIYGNEAPGVLVKGGKTGFTNEAGSCLVSYAVTNKGNAYVFCTGGATYRWAPVYDEIYVYKNIIPASAKDLETETTKMSPNN